MTTPSAADFSQDKVFVEAPKVLPLALFDAMKQAELLDRSIWKDLKTPGRTDVWHHGFFIGGFSADLLECLFDCVSFFPCVFVRYSTCG